MAVETAAWALGAASQSPESFRRLLFAVFDNRPGVYGLTDFATTQAGSPGMSVVVAAGAVLIDGSETANQGAYYAQALTSTTLTIAASNPTNPRRDIVVARIYDNEYSTGPTSVFALEVVTGTPAASPVDPTTPANCHVIARVAVAANATQILNANITDLRFTTAQPHLACLGGVLVCTSTTRPTGNLHAGQVIWETDTKLAYVYSGSVWDPTNFAAPTAWTAPTLLNSWVNFGGSYQVAQYRKVGDVVQIRGSVKSGTTTSGTAIYNLPAGFRPPAQLVFPTLDGSNAIGRFDVTSGGDVIVQVCSANTQFGLTAQFSVTS